MTPDDKTFCDNVIVAGNPEAKYHTFGLVERILTEGIPGAFAEAGVMAGGHIAIMDYVLRKRGIARTIYAFDSFAGIPQATGDDDPEPRQVYGVRPPGEAIKSTGVSAVDLAGFYYFMKLWGVRAENVCAVPGWFQETLPGWGYAPEAPSPTFALLRIDVDLVESVRLCLRYLYPLVVPGGYVVFDDWGLNTDECPANRRALFVGTGLFPGDFTHVEGCPGLVWWRREPC